MASKSTSVRPSSVSRARPIPEFPRADTGAGRFADEDWPADGPFAARLLFHPGTSARSRRQLQRKSTITFSANEEASQGAVLKSQACRLWEFP